MTKVSRQQRCYLSCYRPINNFLLCQPLLNLFYAMGGFSVAIISILWPAPPMATSTALWVSSTIGKILFPLIYAAQLGLIGATYKWNRSLFFTVNELLGGEESRRAKLWEMEEKRGREVLENMRADQRAALSVPMIDRLVRLNIFIRSYAGIDRCDIKKMSPYDQRALVSLFESCVLILALMPFIKSDVACSIQKRRSSRVCDDMLDPRIHVQHS